MTTDREYLEKLVALLMKQPFVQGDKDSIADMVMRYANPPFTRAYPVIMRLTVPDFRALNQLIQQIQDHLKPEVAEFAGGIQAQWPPKPLHESASPPDGIDSSFEQNLDDH